MLFKKHLCFLFLSALAIAAFGQPSIANITLQGDTRYTGRGNANEILLCATVALDGNEQPVHFQSLTLNMAGSTGLADVVALKVYGTSTSTFDSHHPESATLLGTVLPSAGDFQCPLDGSLTGDTLYLWVAADIAPDAVEGHHVDVALKSITTDSQTFTLEQSNPEGDREILLARTTVYRPGDYNSVAYRIPAIITAPDGNLIIATDKRKFNDGDLPQDIDILINRSTDGGHTWSEPLTLAQGTGVNHGFGDCALVRTDDNGGMMAAFVGGVGLWNSTTANPQRSYICMSHDNGMTWSEPRDITNYIFGVNCIYPEHRSWCSSFFGSGNGLRTSTGRIMFVAAIRETSAYSLNNYVIYSDDNGDTWQCSGRASVGGDEAKVVELADGRILMSIRHDNRRWYNISEDGGVTWQSNTSTWNDIVAPACNGDIVRYTSVNQGFDRNRLLHTVPYGTERKDVTMYVSYDEGETWPVSKVLVPYSSAYSSACILPDGTIGFYVEETYPGESGYSTVFYNFSLEWLTGGADHYTPVSVAEHPHPHLMRAQDILVADSTRAFVRNDTTFLDWRYQLWVNETGGYDTCIQGHFVIPKETPGLMDKVLRNMVVNYRDSGYQDYYNRDTMYRDWKRWMGLDTLPHNELGDFPREWFQVVYNQGKFYLSDDYPYSQTFEDSLILYYGMENWMGTFSDFRKIGNEEYAFNYYYKYGGMDTLKIEPATIKPVPGVEGLYLFHYGSDFNYDNVELLTTREHLKDFDYVQSKTACYVDYLSTDAFPETKTPFLEVPDTIDDFENWFRVTDYSKSITPAFAKIIRQSEDVLPLYQGKTSVKFNGLWGVIDLEGNWLLPCIYATPPHYDGIGPSTSILEDFQIRTSWVTLIPPDHYSGWRPLGDHHIALYKDSLCIIFDMGDLQAKDKPTFENVRRAGEHPLICHYSQEFSDGTTFVEDNGMYGVIDTTGKIILPCISHRPTRFVDGIAAIYDKDGNLSACADTNGIHSLSEPYEEYFRQGEFVIVERDGKYGVLNLKKRQLIIPILYDEIGEFSPEGFAPVFRNGRAGFVDIHGNSTFDE